MGLAYRLSLLTPQRSNVRPSPREQKVGIRLHQKPPSRSRGVSEIVNVGDRGIFRGLEAWDSVCERFTWTA